MKWDRRAGGEWSTRSTLVAGMTVTFFGEYREIDKPKRVTRTFSLDQLGTSWANDPATGLIGMLMTQRVGYYAAATPFVEFWGPANAAV